MNVVSDFAHSYAEARDKFLAAGTVRGAKVFRHVHPSERGAVGEELSIDIAQIGAADAPGLLLLTSGTHGVEGFCGSGCQIALLHDEAFLFAVERSGACVLMLHGLNPYGFSHLRRANEDNADLNRNFVDFSAPLPASPAYAELHPLLLPAQWLPPQENEAKLGAWVKAHGDKAQGDKAQGDKAQGDKAFQAAVSGGQYAFPDGMFYGGSGPSWSNACLRAVLRAEAASRRHLGWIDFHTGLGPRGHGEKIYSGPDDRKDIARAKAWWGEDVTSFFDGSSTSARVSGVISAAAHTECPKAEMTAMALEYGTYPLEQTMHMLRAEHWLHNHPEAPAAQRDEIKRALRDTFYIDADDWKEMVYEQAKEACVKALTALSRATGHG